MTTEEGGDAKTDDHSQQSRQRFPSSYFKEKPVKVGQEMDVTISETSRRGEGVARVQGYVIFIPAGKQGQQAKIRITAIRPNFATAEILDSVSTPTA